MATTEPLPTPILGEEGEHCPACGSELAPDQRYCLGCGRRRTGSRVHYSHALAGRVPDDLLDTPAPGPAPAPPPRRPPGVALGLAAAAGAAVLLVGVIVGSLSSGGDEPAQVVTASAPQKAPVVNVTAGGGSEQAAGEEFTSDWPEGKDGYTVQLQTLPSDSAQVADIDQAKGDAESKGAKDVGALLSDDHESLEPGSYIVYSGVYTGKDGKDKATAALKGLKKKFSKAKVIKVSGGAGDDLGAEGTTPEEKPKTVDRSELQDLQNSTGVEQQKKSARLPPTVQVPGKAPKKDKKEPGGGDEGGEVIE